MSQRDFTFTDQDRLEIEQDLGRTPRGVVGVAARDGAGRALVVATAPRLPDGTPFPTTFYLTSPAITAACSTLEAEHKMVDYAAAMAADPQMLADYQAAHRDYLARRARLGEVAEIEGVSAGGMPTRVKCLHALVGHALAAGPGVNPIGDMALAEIRERGMWGGRAVSCLPAELPLAAGADAPTDAPVAAIDCGTNSIRLIIANGGPDGLVDVAREMVVTRLGQGVDRTHRLDADAIERTLAATRVYADQMRAAGVQRARFVTTSASRDAQNRAEFLEPVQAITGLEPQVLTGKQEAELSFLGALSNLPAGLPGPFLLVDIGGGSTEFVLGDTGVLQSFSADMGSVRVTERFGGDPWTGERQREATQWINERLDEVAQHVDLGAAGTLIGVAGTVTSLGALIAGVQQYDPLATHGLTPTREQWAGALATMIEATVEDKAALPFMPPGRADVIGGGALIWREILARVADVPVVVSEHDILDGLALSLLD